MTRRTVRLAADGLGPKGHLHGRPAGDLVKIARQFDSAVRLAVDGPIGDPARGEIPQQRPYEGPVDAKNYFDVMRICGARPGTRFTVRAKGPDASDAVEAVAGFLEGDDLEVQADGQFVTASGGTVVARALEDAVASQSQVWAVFV